MVKLYDYFGLEIYFQEEDMFPLRVYASRNSEVGSLTIIFKDGLFEKISLEISQTTLDDQDKLLFVKIVETNLSEVVKHWIDCYIYKKRVTAQILKNRVEV